MKPIPLRRPALILAAVAVTLAAVSLALFVRALRAEDSAPARKAKRTPAPAAETALPTAAATPAPQPQTDKAVQEAFETFLSANGGTWDLYYESLDTGAYAEAQSGHAADVRSVAASVIKLFVMGAVYDAVQRGDLSHDAVYADLKGMITVSDNDACNRLVRLLGSGDAEKGIAAVNRYIQSLGCASTRMNRLMLQPGEENYVTARDCAAILRLIYAGACVSKSASEEMLALLKAQTVNDRLPANLPQGVTVAHKTGNLINLSCGDVGIVFTPSGDYILCVLSNHSQNDAVTTAAIAQLSRTIYDLVTA